MALGCGQKLGNQVTMDMVRFETTVADDHRLTGNTVHAEYAPTVSVVIPHYNDLEALLECVDMLMSQTWPAGRMEIIVADNNSSCGLAAVVAACPQCRVIAAPLQGAGPARNAGAAVANGDVLAFIDSDCRPHADWIEKGVSGLQGYDFVGGHVETCAANPRAPTAVEAWEIVFGFNFERYILVEGYTGSGNMFTRREVFNAVGGFRTGVAEDMDWSFRARAMGYHLGYVPGARVVHLARPGWAELLQRWRRVCHEHYRLCQERTFGQGRWVIKALCMPLSIFPHTLRILTSPQLFGFAAKVGAVRVLIAHRFWRLGYMLQLAVAERIDAAP